jgi:hypothetical protein
VRAAELERDLGAPVGIRDQLESSLKMSGRTGCVRPALGDA